MLKMIIMWCDDNDDRKSNIVELSCHLFDDVVHDTIFLQVS